MTPILFAFLFMTISDNWRHYYYAGVLVGSVSWILSFFIPESPLFLIAQNRFDEAREVIEKIGRVNGDPLFKLS